MMTMDATIAWPVEAMLGEGPIWDRASASLWFCDIKGGAIHRFTPATGATHSIAIDGQPSFIVPASGGGFIVGSNRSLLHVAPDETVTLLATIDMPAGNRTNDATVDPAGRLWFGTMDDSETAPSGRVYRYDGAIREMGGACTITNGPAVSRDGRFLYHVDTLAGTIWRFDLAANPGTLRDGELFVKIEDDAGHPDGVTIDSEDCLWVGLWGGAAARRYSPAGELLAVVRFPCANVTKVAFGGSDLRTAFATTARIGLSDSERAAQPLAGGLFRFEAPAPGVAPTPVRLPG